MKGNTAKDLKALMNSVTNQINNKVDREIFV